MFVLLQTAMFTVAKVKLVRLLAVLGAVTIFLELNSTVLEEEMFCCVNFSWLVPLEQCQCVAMLCLSYTYNMHKIYGILPVGVH